MMDMFRSLAPYTAEITLGVVLVSLVLYMALDGFDLGVGILSLLERDEEHKEEMMESIATVWDGNESWLVLLGAALFAGFPVVFGTVLPALYIPLILAVVALTFRGVAFEFQEQHTEWNRAWGLSFDLGSLAAAFTQGVALGAFVEGLPISGDAFTGGAFSFLTPFSLLAGLLVTSLYTLSGAAWLAYKTHGELLASVRRSGRIAAVLSAILLALVVAAPLATPVAGALPANAATPETIAFTGFVALAALSIGGTLHTIPKREDMLPLGFASLAMVALAGAFTVAAYPYVVPGAITLAEAAAPVSSAGLLLVAVVPLIPVTIAYNAIAYYVFRGKVSERSDP